MKTLFLLLFLFSNSLCAQDFLLPIDIYDREDLNQVRLTKIGVYGKLRKARPDIPAHLHTGIDIKRPKPNFNNEPIFSIGEGVVISKREDGPYALLIIEYNFNGELFWAEYEHIAEIKVNIGDWVNKETIIARFMNKEELNKYGWQFDHFHFELLKVPPQKAPKRKDLPDFQFKTYNLVCYSADQLKERYYDPFEFLNKLISN